MVARRKFREDNPPPRVERRFKVFLPIIGENAGREYRLHLLDLSENGARLHGDAHAEIGDHISLWWNGRKYHGSVIWQRDRMFGLAFNAAMPMAIIDAILAPAAPQP